MTGVRQPAQRVHREFRLVGREDSMVTLREWIRTRVPQVRLMPIVYLVLGVAVTGHARRGFAADFFVDAGSGSDADDGLSWPNALASVQAAFVAVQVTPEADTISVSSGWYRINADFPPRCNLLGGYPSGGGLRDPLTNRTVLDGGGVATVLRFLPGCTSAVLDGFTIRGGHGVMADEGGGVTIIGCDPLIVNCTIEGNEGCQSGGLFVRVDTRTMAPPLIADTILQANVGSCGASASQAAAVRLELGTGMPTGPLLFRCLIRGNENRGLRDPAFAYGAMQSTGSVMLQDCLIRDNQGCGVVMGDGPELRVDNCEVSGNQDWGIAVVCSVQQALFTNVTVADNGLGELTGWAPIIGFGIWAIDMRRSIIWGSQPTVGGAIGCDGLGDPPTITIDDSLVSGGFPAGTDILDLDPTFTPGAHGAYYLSQIAAGQATDSPALDAGNVTAVAAGLDLLSTRTDSGSDAGQVDLGVHYRPSGMLLIRRGVAADALAPLATVSGLPYDDVGALADSTMPLAFYRVEWPLNIVLVTKVPATASVRLTF